jgi:hypothetical protein
MTMFIVLVVPDVPVTLVSPLHSSTVATVVSFVISSISSRRPTKKSQLSSKTLLVRALDLEVVDVVVVAQVVEAVEVEPTVISVNSEAAVVDQDTAVAVVADLVDPQLLATAVALVDLLPLQLPMVVLQLTVVALAVAAMATHPGVEAANRGGNFTLHGASLFLFDSTSVHLRRDKGVNGYPSRMQNFPSFSTLAFAFPILQLSIFWWR